MIFLVLQILKSILGRVIGVLTNPTVQKVAILSVVILIVTDTAGIYTFNQFYADFLDGIILWIQAVIDWIIQLIDQVIEWFNQQVIAYIQNEVI